MAHSPPPPHWAFSAATRVFAKYTVSSCETLLSDQTRMTELLMALTDSILGTSNHLLLKPRWMVQPNAVTCMGNHHWNCKIQSGIHHFVEIDFSQTVIFVLYHGYCSSSWGIKTCTVCECMLCSFPKTCQIFSWIDFFTYCCWFPLKTRIFNSLMFTWSDQ